MSDMGDVISENGALKKVEFHHFLNHVIVDNYLIEKTQQFRYITGLPLGL
jgi:hypothetical protein